MRFAFHYGRPHIRSNKDIVYESAFLVLISRGFGRRAPIPPSAYSSAGVGLLAFAFRAFRPR